MSAGQSDLCDGRLSGRVRGGGGSWQATVAPGTDVFLFFLRQQASLGVGPNRQCSLRERNNLPLVPENFLGHREASHPIM